MPYATVAVGWVLVVVFALSSVGKVRGPAAFAESVRDLGGPGHPAIPVLVVVAEMAVAVLLVLPSRTAATAGFVLAAGLLAVFTAVVARVVRQDRATPCRCFGATTTPLGRQHVVRNLVLTACALTGALGPPAPPLDAGAVFAAAFGVLAGLLVAMSDHLVALFTPISAKES
ncbi:MAG TPA: MauE/DoxX family redox-associated membrane protein [Umezawaea sp.]|nr:MauE/DoxX family redox-associated membrane protein [Umezawaea sp.]